MELTPHQQSRLDRVLEWYSTPGTEPYVLGGLAGTGKTTLISRLTSKDIARDLTGNPDTVIAAAFTGKAVSAMNEKGVPNTCTLHSLLYKTRLVKDKDNKVVEILHEPRNKIEDTDLIVVDEASMVGKDIYDLLCQHAEKGIKVLFVGDIGQLPPVNRDPGIMARPDTVLREIHRQALESDIVRFAHWLREENAIREFRPHESRREVWIGYPTTDQLAAADQVLCGFNRTRHGINKQLRRHKFGSRVRILEPGDKLVCLINNKKHALYNGTCAAVSAVRKVYGSDQALVDIQAGARKIKKLLISTRYLGSETGIQPDDFTRGQTFWDYGYCLTTHKAQGSEWKRVIVFEEQCRHWEPQRWNYTAVTRAKTQLLFYPGASW